MIVLLCQEYFHDTKITDFTDLDHGFHGLCTRIWGWGLWISRIYNGGNVGMHVTFVA
jgi:hypothetical protein